MSGGNPLPPPARQGPLHILVVGMGNVLRRDDGFGVVVARRLLDMPPPLVPVANVTVVEAGISGVRIVQELLAVYDGLIFVDATARGEAPGTLYELEPQPPTGAPGAHQAPISLHTMDFQQVMVLARAAGCLPPRLAVVGCEPADYDELALDLSPPVAAAVPRAIALILKRIEAWQQA